MESNLIKKLFFEKIFCFPVVGREYSVVPLGIEHSEEVVKWRNNPKNLELFENTNMITLESQRVFMTTYDEKDRVDLVLLFREQPIGVFNIKNLECFPEYGALIGEESFRGLGLSSKMKKAMLEFWFNILDQHSIFVKLRSKNEYVIKSNLRIGFEFVDNEGELTILKLDKERWNNDC